MKPPSIDLLKKYNVQGPRYTSYPPAPSWSSVITSRDYEEALKESARVQAPLSLYFHLPFCEALCYFCGCTTVITGKNRSYEDPYLAVLKKEIDWVSERLGSGRRVAQFHLGGGTPTYSEPKNLDRLLGWVKEKFDFDSTSEVGAEVDPRVTTAAHLETLRKRGFNRLSMGVQDFDPTVQKSINRIQPFEVTRDLIQKARDLGFESINIDLIYGLPHQTRESFRTTIEQILSIGPDRLAVYSYAHVPWLKKHQDLLEAHLPKEEEKIGILLLAMERFTGAGFEYIGMDHFAKPSDELAKARQTRTLWRNFQGYTTKAGTDLIGFGMSAIGQVQGVFVQNEKELKTYQEAVQARGSATARGFRLAPDDKVRSRVIQNLLCHAKVVKKEVEQEFGIQFDSYFAEALEKLKGPAADGLVVLSSGEIQPTETGRVFLRNLAMPFDATLPKEGSRVFSKTV